MPLFAESPTPWITCFEGYGETLLAGMEEGGVGSLVEIESADSTCEYFDVGNLSRAFIRMFKLLAV